MYRILMIFKTNPTYCLKTFKTCLKTFKNFQATLDMPKPPKPLRAVISPNSAFWGAMPRLKLFFCGFPPAFFKQLSIWFKQNLNSLFPVLHKLPEGAKWA